MNEEVRTVETKYGTVKYRIAESTKSEQEQKDDFYKFLANFIIRNVKNKNFKKLE